MHFALKKALMAAFIGARDQIFMEMDRPLRKCAAGTSDILRKRDKALLSFNKTPT